MCSMSCADGVYRGMHIVYGDYRLDTLIDPSTQKPIPITNGARGELQITTLGWEATPVIKISLGDLNQIFTDPCPCGMPGYRRIVVGRVDDMLIVKGINVYPSAVKDIITSFAPRVTGEFRIILEQPPPLVPPPVKMKVEYGSQVELNELESLKNSITGTCSRLLRFNPEIELVPPGTLERSTKKGKILEKRYEL